MAKASNTSNARLRRALEKCQSTLVEPEVVPGKYPMYVISFEHFMNMRSVQTHEELHSSGILVEFVPEMGDAIFVSHQWLGFTHPDINFQQLRVLQRAFDELVGRDVPLKSSVVSYAFFGHENYIDTRKWRRDLLFIWYDYFSCPQLVARSQELQAAIDSIGHYVQAAKHFVVLAPCVEHSETGQLLGRESWRGRGWCRFERVCREFSCADSRIVVIESPQHCYVMAPYDSWLRPACLGHFTVERDRDKVHNVISGMLHAKLVSCLENSDLRTYRTVLNLQHVFMRTNGLSHVSHSCSSRELATQGQSLLPHFLKENRFEHIRDQQFGWSPACYAALRGDAQVLKEILAAQGNINDCVKVNEVNFHIYKGMSLLMICAQFSNNVALRLLMAHGADVNLRDSLGCTVVHRAGVGNNSEGLRILMEAGCNPHLLDGFGHNPAPPICTWGNLNGLQTLLDLVPRLDLRRGLHVSVFGEGDPEEIIPELLAAGADINERLPMTLQWRKWRLHLELVASLAKCLQRHHGSGFIFFITNIQGATPLICSLLSRSFHAAAILIAAGADVTLKNAQNPTSSFKN